MSRFHGACLCGAVRFAVDPPVGNFQYCHCSRCRKATGTAHAANLFVPAAQFEWLAGEELARRWELPTAKYWCNGFCGQCGAKLPWRTRNERTMVIPAGTLDEDPGVRPQRNIWLESRPPWYVAATDLPEFDTYPPRDDR